MIINPIWKDTVLEVTDTVFEFSIKVGDVLIYRGRAYKRPNAENNVIKINKIVETYLSNGIETLLNSLEDNPNGIINENEEAFKIFDVYDKDNVLIESYGFLYDWSYIPRNLEGIITLSKPINGRYSKGMYKLNTEYNSEMGKVFNSIHSATPNIEHCNGKYALYYLNSYGGWDSFLFEGEVIKEDKYSQYTTDKTYNNNSIDYEMYRYVNEIQTSYKCNTGWLTDEQAENFVKELISTNYCYLHNLMENKIIPVLIDEKSARYQKYSTNGNMMAQYEIIIKESQTRIRR